MVPIFHGQVDELGSALAFEPHDKPRYRSWIRSLAGKAVEIIVRLPQRQRSHAQLRYWFGVPMKLLSEKTGYTKMQMHYLCLAICYGVIVDEATGREVPVVAASRGLTTKQFAELIEWCPVWALEAHGISIPPPNEIDIDSLPGFDEEEMVAA